jgi:hypothetical protein
MNIQKILGPNWVPRVLGFVALVAGVISQSPGLLSHAIPTLWIPAITAWAGIITAVSGAFFVGSLKAHNVTGGTVAATPEAVERVAEDKPTANPPAIQSTVLPSTTTKNT